MSELASALVAALADCAVVEKSSTANAGSFSYDYADIAALVRLTRPKLAEHGLVALTPVHEHNNGLACTVTLLHTSGERHDFPPFPFPHGRDAQATGSMVTYHRRYALLSALGMAAGGDEDDDGAKAQARELPPAHASEEQLMEIEAWIHTATPEQQTELKAWWKTQRIPKLELLTADQAERVLRHARTLELVPSGANGDGDGAPTPEPSPPEAKP